MASFGTANPVISSVVLLRADGEVLIGDVAVRRGLAEPTRVAREFKRRLGDPTPLVLGGTPYSAESLMGHLLRGIVDAVTAQEGEAPERVVLTHPATYGPYKLEQMHEVARLGGLDLATTSFLTEPQAAAISYASRNRVETGETVAVYDFGGGTFDVALVQSTGQGFEIVGRPEGLERFGGIDIDAAIVAFVDDALEGALTRLDWNDPAVQADVARLRDECRAAKEALSGDTDTSITVSLPGVRTEIRLTRRELEGMIKPRLNETFEALERAVRSAGMTLDQISRVLLVGGSSRIPLVSEFIRERSGRPVAVDAHPKFAIALGAGGSGGAGLGASGPLESSPIETQQATASDPVTVASVPTAVAPVPFSPAAHTVSGPSAPAKRTKLLVALGAVAVVAIAGIAVVAFSGNSDAPTVASNTTVAVSGPAKAAAATSVATTEAVTTAPPPSDPSATTAEPETTVTAAEVTIPPGALDLGNGLFMTMPDTFTLQPSDSGTTLIDNGIVTATIYVRDGEADEDPLIGLQQYVDSFDSLSAAAMYSQVVPKPVDTSGTAPSDSVRLDYQVFNSNDSGGLRGEIIRYRRADGLTLMTDISVPLENESGATVPSEAIDELYRSFLDAPLTGPVASLTPPGATRINSVFPSFKVNDLVELSPPPGWTVEAPGPTRVLFVSPEGQRFGGASIDGVTNLEEAKARAQSDVELIAPGATLEEFKDTPTGTFNFTFAFWRAPAQGTTKATTGVISIWFNPLTGEAYEALQQWPGDSFDMPLPTESHYLFSGFDTSIGLLQRD